MKCLETWDVRPLPFLPVVDVTEDAPIFVRGVAKRSRDIQFAAEDSLYPHRDFVSGKEQMWAFESAGGGCTKATASGSTQ